MALLPTNYINRNWSSQRFSAFSSVIYLVGFLVQCESRFSDFHGAILNTLVSGTVQNTSKMSLFFRVNLLSRIIPILGFPDSSVGKEFTCNARDAGSIPGSGRSAGEGIGYPLQYSSASLVAQLVKNIPTMRKTWVWSLGWEDPLEKGKATHSSILAWKIPWTSPWGHKESDTTVRCWLHFTSFPS